MHIDVFSRCSRINNSHTMIIGGFTSAVIEENPKHKKDGVKSTNVIRGGHQNRRTWIYNTTNWIETAESSIARDRPACSLVNMPNGKVITFLIYLLKTDFKIILNIPDAYFVL